MLIFYTTHSVGIIVKNAIPRVYAMQSGHQALAHYVGHTFTTILTVRFGAVNAVVEKSTTCTHATLSDSIANNLSVQILGLQHVRFKYSN